MTDKKRLRNKVYLICGCVMAGCLALVAALSWLAPWIVIFGEIAALQAFGFAWLVKGDAIPFFRDAEEESDAEEEAEE